MSTKRKAQDEMYQAMAKMFKIPRGQEIGDQEFDGLFGEIGDGLARLEERVAALREEKAAMFEAIASRVQQEVHADNIDAFDRTMGSVRESYLERLREDLKARFDRLPEDLEGYFRLKSIVAAKENIKRLPDCSTLCFVKQKSATFKENESSTTVLMTKFCGALKWTNSLTSFQCLKWYRARFITRNSFEPRASFTFSGKDVQVRHNPVQENRRVKHDYLFDVVDKKGKVLSSFPFETSYDIFAPTTPATFYTYGPRLLLVTSFAKIPTNLVFNMLKKLDVNDQLPPTRPWTPHSACHFVLFDANFRLVKEFMTCASLQVRNFSIKVDFLNDKGIMVSNLFHATDSIGYPRLDTCTKRLVTFYDYNFKPVLRNLELPDSPSVCNLVKMAGKLIFYVSLSAVDKENVQLNTFHLGAMSVISAKPFPRKFSQLTRSVPTKFLLDSKNNLYSIQKSRYSAMPDFVQDHVYFVCCVSVDILERYEIDQQAYGVSCQGCYLDENDQLTIVSKSGVERRLLFSKFAAL